MGSYTLCDAELMALLGYLRSQQSHHLPPEMESIISNLESVTASLSSSSGTALSSPMPQPMSHDAVNGMPMDGHNIFTDGRSLCTGDMVSNSILLPFRLLNIYQFQI